MMTQRWPSIARAPTIAAIAAASLLAGCPPASTRPEVATVTVALADSSIAVQRTTTASAVVRDGGGNILTDRAVAWTTSDVAVARIDPAGVVSASSPGSVSVVATVEGVSGSTGLAVTAGPAAQIVKDAGDGQVATPASPVAVAPRVRIADAYGFPVPGAAVSFAVASGGGTVATAEAVTTADGFASCGAWSLGAAIGSQTLTASIEDAPPVTFTATALRTSGDLGLTVVAPTADALVGDSFTAVAQVSSTYEIASVTVSVGGLPVALAYQKFYVTRECRLGCWGWVADLSSVGLPSGPRDVVVTATDVLGHVTDAVVSVRLDRPPTIRIVSPAAGTVARGTVTVSATCDDPDGGCAHLWVYGARQTGSWVPGAWQTDPLLSGTNAVSGQVDVSSQDGNVIDLSFSAADTAGQVRTVVLHDIYVEASDRLSVVTSVPGTIWDFSANRVLFVDQGHSPPLLRIGDTISGTTEDVTSAVDLGAASYGYLTPSGAIYAEFDPTIASSCVLREWRDGASMTLGPLSACSSLRTAGSFAVYATPGGLIRRDLAAGASITISDMAMPLDNDVARSGNVVYVGTDDHNVYAWAEGVATALTSDGPTTFDRHVRTDGVNTLYVKDTALVLHDGIGETTLASDGQEFLRSDHAVADGWIAYARRADAAAPYHVWRRHGSASEQLTFFSSSDSVDAIGSDGTIVLTNGGRRYLAAPGAPLLDVASQLGELVYRDGTFFVLLGGSVLAIAPRGAVPP
jgi:hypothetical protein